MVCPSSMPTSVLRILMTIPPIRNHRSPVMMVKRRHFLLLLISLLTVTECSPLADSIKCSNGTTDCTITNVYGAFPDRTTCRARDVVYPTTEVELLDVIAAASRSKRKIKVATRYSNSIPKLSCPDGDDGLLISTKFLNRIVSVNMADMTMTVESGARMKEVINAAAKAGLAVPHSTFWWGVTIGGLLATGSYGSSLSDKGSALHEYIVSVRMVTPGPRGLGLGDAIIRYLNTSHSELDAAKVSLGVLGVISQVTLKLQPNFKRAVTYSTISDSDIADRAVTIGNQHEFASIFWYPHLRTVDYAVDDRVALAVPGNGYFRFVGFRPIPNTVSKITRYNEERIENSTNPNEKCIASNITRSLISNNAYGLTNDDNIFTGYPVIGLQNKIQSSGSCMDDAENSLVTTCAWDPRVNGLFFHETSVSISLSKAKDFILEVQKLRDINPHAFCGLELYIGIVLRYVKASTAYLGEVEDVIKFDMKYYRSKNPMTPRLNQDVFEEIEQMALFKYNGLPHWGKNRNLAFDGVIGKYVRASKFLKVKDEFDPDGLFSSEWTDQILGINGRTSISREGCALDGLCVCSQDLHCAPEKGYFCRPGKVYGDARVCTKLG